MVELAARARAADLTLVENPVRHMGTDTCRRVLGSLFQEVAESAEVRFRAGCSEVASGWRSKPTDSGCSRPSEGPVSPSVGPSASVSARWQSSSRFSQQRSRQRTGLNTNSTRATAATYLTAMYRHR